MEKYQKYIEVDFDEEVCKDKDVPKYLLRKRNEEYEEDIKRITNHMIDMPIEKLNNILGAIDPTEDKNGPAIDFVTKIIEEKRKNPVVCAFMETCIIL